MQQQLHMHTCFVKCGDINKVVLGRRSSFFEPVCRIGPKRRYRNFIIIESESRRTGLPVTVQGDSGALGMPFVHTRKPTNVCTFHTIKLASLCCLLLLLLLLHLIILIIIGRIHLSLSRTRRVLHCCFQLC